MNINHGLIRLWVALSVLWSVFCGYKIYFHDKNYKLHNENAVILGAIIDIQRNEMAENYFNANRLAVENINKGGATIQFNEAKAKEQALSSAWNYLKDTQTNKEAVTAHKDALKHEKKRNSYLMALPALPIAVGAIYFLALWVVRGFKKR